MNPYSFDPTVYAMLKSLKPLKKVTHTWPLHPSMPDGYCTQWAMICKAITFRDTDTEGVQAIRACQARDAGAQLSMLTTPLGSGVEPTFFSRLDDIAQHRQRYLEIAKRLGDVKLSAVLIDIETLSTQTDPPYEIDQLHQALHDAINEAFGDDCELIWYGNLIHPAACETGWALDDWSPSHKWGTYSCELYYPTMLPLAREMVRRNMKSHIVGQPLYNEIVPWVSLGCGRDYDKDGNLTQWNKNWDYPVRYDALLGSELYNGPWNDPVRFAPYDKVKKVVLYPGPDLGGNCANFWPHFSAFVRGASGEKI